MKKGLLLIAMVCGLLTACIDGKKAEVKADLNIAMDSVDVEMIQLYGTVGDGTSMHSLELVSDETDTLYLTYDNNVIGGVDCGDRVCALFCNNGDEFEALSIINVSSLAHLWQLDADTRQHLELSLNGNATSYGMPASYSTWAIHNGQLLLSNNGEADTYSISLLTEQKLILESDNNTLNFTRQN